MRKEQELTSLRRPPAMRGENADAAKAGTPTLKKLTESRLATLAGNGGLDGAILEIETNGKTILYPQKKAYGIPDIVLAAGIGAKNALSRILEALAAGNPTSNHLSASSKPSFTESDFTKLVAKLTAPIPERKKRRLKEDISFILPDRQAITISTLYPTILQKLIDCYKKGRVSHADFADININTFHALISSFRKSLPAGWEIVTHETTPPGQEHKCEYELKKAEDKITEEEQVQVVREPAPTLLGLSKTEEEEVTRMKKCFRSGLTETLLSHLANKTRPQSKAWEFLAPLIQSQSSRKIMRIVPFSDQNIVKRIIMENFQLGIRELIAKGPQNNSNPAYSYYQQLEEKGYAFQKIVEEISDFFPSETTEFSASPELKSQLIKFA